MSTRNLRPAHMASLRRHAKAAAADPLKLAKAARVVRAGLASGALTVEDLTAPGMSPRVAMTQRYEDGSLGVSDA